MNVDFMDSHGTQIQATFFKEAVDRFEALIKENHVYIVSNGSIKTANK